jgi:hypothetical protein
MFLNSDSRALLLWTACLAVTFSKKLAYWAIINSPTLFSFFFLFEEAFMIRAPPHDYQICQLTFVDSLTVLKEKKN